MPLGKWFTILSAPSIFLAKDMSNWPWYPVNLRLVKHDEDILVFLSSIDYFQQLLLFKNNLQIYAAQTTKEIVRIINLSIQKIDIIFTIVQRVTSWIGHKKKVK